MEDIKGSVKVYVEKDSMTAMIQVIPPAGNGEPAGIDDAMRELAERKIVVGIDHDKIREALLPANWEQWVEVAKGTPAEHGTDGRLIYQFNLQQKYAPVIDEQDRVDYHDLGVVANVKKGQLLVQRVPPEPGKSGKNIYGIDLAPRLGRDFNLPRGRNTVSNEDQTGLYSTIDGHVSIIDNKVMVDPIYELFGDVDFSSGNIDFVGDIIVRGNVVNGFKVVSKGNIRVLGFIEGAEVIADGDIEVKGGIKTGSRGLVKAGGTITAHFVENSRLEAGKDIIIREAVMQSYLRAGERVLVTDKKASIIGGVIQASHHVEARLIGSQLATQTIIEVGVNPYYREEYQKILKVRTDLKRSFDNINHSLQSIQKAGVSPQDLPDKKRIHLIKMLDEYKTTHQELSKVEERIEFLEGEFHKVQSARVRAFGIVYPGVRITIGNAIHTVNDAIKEVDFILKDGEVQMQSVR